MTKKAWSTGAAAGLGCLLVALSLFLSSQRAEATHSTFAPGDVFVSLKGGGVQWWHPDGTFNRMVLGVVPGNAEGMGFDASLNLYVTHWCADTTCLTGNTVERFNPSGVSQGTFGSGYGDNPMSIVFDANGNAYVGQADTTKDILKFNALGVTGGSYNAATENRGTNWIDLDGSGCVIYYTSDGPNVLRFNVCANDQMANFNQEALPGFGHALRILPDGGVLVAAESVIARLNASGNLVQVYDVPGEQDLWFGLDLVGDGTFWASNFGSGNVVRFNIATGAVGAVFNAGPSQTVKGVAVVTVPSQVYMRGRMTGGGSVFTEAPDYPAGIRVTHGFELHCDWNRKPNNLEINLHSGGAASGRYHLENLTYATCYDDPNINPFPPQAPFDTYYGEGTGRYNGQSGYTAEWIFTDAGEPGREDRIKRLIITDSNGTVVLSIVEQGKPLTYGNHQAHR